MEQLIFVVVLVLAAVGKWFFENAGSFGGGDTPDERPSPPQRRSPGGQPPGAPARPRSAETEEERVRRFMEALGLPSNAPMPQRPRPETEQREQRAPVQERRASVSPLTPPKPDIRHLGEPFGAPKQPSPLRRRRENIETRRQPAPRPEQATPQAPAPFSAPISAPVSAPMSEVAPAMEVASFESAGRGVVETAAAGVESAARMTSTSGVPTAGEGTAVSVLKQQLRDPASLRRAILLREILGAPKGLQSAATPSILPIP